MTQTRIKPPSLFDEEEIRHIVGLFCDKDGCVTMESIKEILGESELDLDFSVLLCGKDSLSFEEFRDIMMSDPSHLKGFDPFRKSYQTYVGSNPDALFGMSEDVFQRAIDSVSFKPLFANDYAALRCLADLDEDGSIGYADYLKLAQKCSFEDFEEFGKRKREHIQKEKEEAARIPFRKP